MSRLRPFHKNNDKLFPKREVRAYYDFGNNKDEEWLVDEILAHQWKGNTVSFLVQWNLGDMTWESYSECKELAALDRYLELLGIKSDEWKKLLRKTSATPGQTSNHSSTSKPARRVNQKKT
jgi:hypothetical protein